MQMGRDDCCSVLSSAEWKVYLQLILLETHTGSIDIDAVICTDNVQSSVSEGSSTAYLLQSKESIIRQAISEVPKSGEVWCEWGRCTLNTQTFDISQSLRSLCFANQFTLQYGDTFVEYIRVELLAQVLLPRVLEALNLPLLSFLKAHLQCARGASLMCLPCSLRNSATGPASVQWKA